MSRTPFKASCIQLSVGPDPEENFVETENLVRAAAGEGALFITTPENTCFIDTDKSRKFERAQPSETHPLLPKFSKLAKDLGVWLQAGSLKIRIEGADRLANRSHLFSPAGDLVATYDKIHLYDVDLPNGEIQRESSEFTPGDRAVLANLPDFKTKLGMTICYDVRFPHLYRDLARAGAEIFTVPSAFTVPTGQAHWEVMLRARAIESGSFVLAPAQGGNHDGTRVTYGHSMIIDPWGHILAEKPDDTPGIITAEIDLSKVDRARAAIRQLRHDRQYEII